MSNITALKKPPSDLADHLREMANLVDAGKLTCAVIGYTLNDNREFTYGASLSECLLLSTMLQQNCIDRMRA